MENHLLSAAIATVLLAPAAHAASSRPPDQRLDQKVTMEAVGEPLEVVLRQLSEQTKVTFRFEGREVGDRKAIIIVREVPLKELKETLAATFFGYRWREERLRQGKEVGYVLYGDVRSRQIEAALQSLPEQRRQQRLRQLLAALHNGGQDLDAEGQRLVREPGTRTALDVLAGFSPGQLRSLFSEHYLPAKLNIDGLTPEEQRYWSLEVGAQVENVRRKAAGLPELLEMSEAKPFPLRELPDLSFHFVLSEPDNGSSTLLLVLNSSIVAHQAPGLALAAARLPLSGAMEKDAIQIAEVKQFLTGSASESDDAKDPTLERKVEPLTREQESKLRPPSFSFLFGPYWAQWLTRFARRTGILVVSDCYTDGIKLPAKDPTNMTVREALDEACRAFERRWVKRGPLYSFRYNKWYLAAPAEPPQRVLDALQTAFDKKGRPDLEDLAVGGELSKEQLVRAMCLNMPYYWIFRDNYTTTRLLNALTTTQRAMAQGNGLALATVSSPTAREWFRLAALKTNPRLEETDLDRAVLRIRSQVDAKNTLTLSFQWLGPEGERSVEDVRIEAGVKG